MPSTFAWSRASCEMRPGTAQVRRGWVLVVVALGDEDHAVAPGRWPPPACAGTSRRLPRSRGSTRCPEVGRRGQRRERLLRDVGQHVWRRPSGHDFSSARAPAIAVAIRRRISVRIASHAPPSRPPGPRGGPVPPTPPERAVARLRTSAEEPAHPERARSTRPARKRPTAHTA